MADKIIFPRRAELRALLWKIEAFEPVRSGSEHNFRNENSFLRARCCDKCVCAKRGRRFDTWSSRRRGMNGGEWYTSRLR
jgi:hypothetical protein